MSSTTQLLMVVAVAASVCVAEPGQPTIQAQVDAAAAAGLRRVRIAPGVYRAAPASAKEPGLRLHRLDGLEIDATGVTLLCTSLGRAVDLYGCTHLTLRGLTIDYDPLPMTQGTIVGFGPKREWTDVKLHAGYPAPTALTGGWGFLWTTDALTRCVKAGTANRPNKACTDQGGGVWRVDHGFPIPDQAAVGDCLRIPQAIQTDTGLFAAACGDLTLEGVTLHAAPYHFATSFRWCRDLTLRSCRIVPGPPPRGASEARVFSSVGDGFNCAGITGALRILDCETEATGDDGIAVYTVPLLVYGVDGQKVTLSFETAGAPLLAAGTRLRFYCAATGQTEEATISACARSAMPRADLLARRQQLMPQIKGNAFLDPLEVSLAAPVQARPGDEACSLEEAAQETVIRGCRVRNAGSRGIVANRSRIRVEDNRIEDTFFPAVHVFAFFGRDGGPGFQEDVRLAGNRVARANLARQAQADFLGSLCVVCWDRGEVRFGGHRRVTVADNQIAGSWGVDVQVQAASDVVVRGNRLLESHALPAGAAQGRPVDNRAAIFLQDVVGAVVEGNQLADPGPHLGGQPLATVNVTGLRAEQAFTPTARKNP